MSENMLITVADGVLRIQFNRPEKKNALTRDMYAAFAGALERGKTDDGIRCLLITGTADCFTAGNDIGDFQRRGTGVQEKPRTPDHYITLAPNPQPVVAAVGGLAVGIGTTMLLHCDLVFASTAARFRMPIVDLNLVPELGASLLVPMLAGRHKAAELLLLGDFFGAETAREIGLVNRVCAPAELEAEAMGVAKRLAAKPPASLRLTKGLLLQNSPALMERMQAEIELFRAQLASPETQAILGGVLKPKS